MRGGIGEFRKIRGCQGVCEETLDSLVESIKANPAEQETTVFPRKHLPWPADAWRAREHATRLKRTGEQKIR